MPLAFSTGTSSHYKNTLQKRKFEIKILLLLHVLIPGVMLSSSIETINPWLSACDLKQPDLKGSCVATTQFPASTTTPPDAELLCPEECSPKESKTNASCLAYLDETRRNAICNFNLGNGIEWLKSFLGTIRLRHCCEYKIIESLSSSLLERVLRGKDECFRIIDSLVEVDNLAAHVTCEYSQVLSRYDCGQPYSVKFSCNDCLEAYRRWVCSTLVPYYNETVRVRPCRSVCQAVEQKCPYFLPENKAPALPTQYAGEPTFLCMDPNIPETGMQQTRSLYPDDTTCCVKICGSLKDGLCVDKGTKCKSEDLISYEEALDQIVECSPTDSFGTRVPSMECTASEPYSSPHKLGSGGSKTGPGPTLLLFSVCLNQTFARGFHSFLFFLLIYYYFPSVSLNVLVCLSAVTGCFAQTRLLLARFKVVTKLFFLFVKWPCLFLNYLKFESKKWQYFFILISVNLLFNLFIINSQPFKTPLCFNFIKETRRARRYYYYFFYNYYYRSKFAQRLNGKSRKRFRCTSRGPFNLAAVKNGIEKRLIRIKNDSLTLNRIKERSRIYKIIIRMKRDISVGTTRFHGPSVRGMTEAVVEPALGPVGGTPVHFPLETERESARKLNLVKMCRESSDPKCESQTLS